MRAWYCSAKSPAETPPWRRLERSVERRLDAPPDTEEVTIAAVLANDHQPEGRTHRPYRHGNCAAIEEIDNRRVRSPVSAFRWCHEDRLADEKKIFGRVRANPTKRWRRLAVAGRSWLRSPLRGTPFRSGGQDGVLARLALPVREYPRIAADHRLDCAINFRKKKPQSDQRGRALAEVFNFRNTHPPPHNMPSENFLPWKPIYSRVAPPSSSIGAASMPTEYPPSPQTTNEYIREEMTRLLHTNHIYTLDSHGWIDADTYDPEMVGHTMNQLDSLSWRFLDAAMNSPSPPQLA
jgi:hypothetical protein